MRSTLVLFLFVGLSCASLPNQTQPQTAPVAQSEWVQLFNGKDLSGWKPKIRGYPYGENFGNTFRVEGGVLKVSYDQYQGKFQQRFGHLFYEKPFSHYILRVVYRFVGDQIADGPKWAFRNSGAMLHCQAPETMALNQDFPVSIEGQLLGGNGSDPRPTANLCTPGTNVVMNGALFTPHCELSTSRTYHGDQWVTVEFEVHGAGQVRHLIDGEPVIAYEQPQLDPNDPDGRKLIQGRDLLIGSGYIALQSESHPIEFRTVELKVLPAP